ncbi:MAG: T9SS type A sorting domain-containing protein [Chitinophagaceae bacterium]
MKLMVTVNPNPFTSSLVIYIKAHFTVNTVLRLLNQNGTVIRVTACTINQGENKITINNLNRYATGNYLLEVKLLNGDLLETISLVKA